MIFLSVQPDSLYYIWQLDILIHNVVELGFHKENIHILFGFDPEEGLNPAIEEFADKNKIKIFVYPDTRLKKNYPSSLRPHIIAKHFTTFPYLQNECFFYHDADIIFRELPDFTYLEKENTWYVADTKNYLGYKYLTNCLDNEQINKMCNIVGITVKDIIDNDTEVGGAQYVIKRSSANFWEKVEQDCEDMYNYLTEINNQKRYNQYIITGKYTEKIDNGIQAWCTDMWVVLWNAWILNIETKTHKDLDFCWPFNSIFCWNNKKILHYSGNINIEKKEYFRKQNYNESTPFYDYNLEYISVNSSSYPLYKKIINYKETFLNNHRINLHNCLFLLKFSKKEEDTISSIKIIANWLDKLFSTKIIIVEQNNLKNFNSNHLIQKNANTFQDLKGYIKEENLLINKDLYKDVSYVITFPNGLFVDKNSIIKYINRLKKTEKSFFINGVTKRVDSIFKIIFSKLVEDECIIKNIDKFNFIQQPTDQRIMFSTMIDWMYKKECMFERKHNKIFQL